MLFKTETEIINEICVVYEKTFFKLFQFFFPIFFVPLLAVGLASSTMGPFSFRASNVSFLSYYTDIIYFLQFCEHQENMVRPFVQRCFFHLISSWRISKKMLSPFLRSVWLWKFVWFLVMRSSLLPFLHTFKLFWIVTVVTGTFSFEIFCFLYNVR